ncbi:hypothetical protein [Bernardetia sp.]|uniref:hypothetical protein n=1 Tax=Bernardetia sp. TaxID=1937974 RepID=UPI0025BCBB1C|nr:hypothetical protein [Bernardetia sp.]
MILAEDPIFETLQGCYGEYNPIPNLKKLEENSDNEKVRKEILNDFLDNLYHQGSVYLVSFLTLPLLIRLAIKKNLSDLEIITLVGFIEMARSDNNVEIPTKYLADYEREIKNVTLIAHTNKDWDYSYTLISTMAITAANGQKDFADSIFYFDRKDTKFLRAVATNKEYIEDVLLQANMIDTKTRDKNQLNLF